MKPRSRVLARHAENFKVLCPVVQSKFTFRDSHFPLSASQFKPISSPLHRQRGKHTWKISPPMCPWSLQVTKHDGLLPSMYVFVVCVGGALCAGGASLSVSERGVLPREASFVKLLSRVVVGID